MRFLLRITGALAVFSACTSTTSAPNDAATQATDGGDGSTQKPDGASPGPEDASVPTGACPSGNVRPLPAVVAAINKLIGAWTVVPADGSQRVLGFGEPPGAISTGSPDWGCVYADRDGIDLYYDQPDSVDPGVCYRNRYRFQVVEDGLVMNGSYTGSRVALLADGGPAGKAPIQASWSFPGTQLLFDAQHFTKGATFHCP